MRKTSSDSDVESQIKMNERRTNPFRSSEKNHFPPLDEFFYSSSSRPPIPTKNLSPDQSLCSKASLLHHDLSMDISIAGRAAMAEHTYRVRKCAMDASACNAVNDRPSLSDSDDWGKLMDDTCSNVSFSSSAYVQKSGSKYRSRDDVDTSVDVSTSYFDKSVINSLLTPEKIKSAVRDMPAQGITLRGHDNTESPDGSVGGCSTNVSSRCSGVEEMFHAALRFHDDLQESILITGESNMKDKSSSVSFAADTSFLSTIDGRNVSRRKKTEHIEELNFLFGSPINKCENDDSFAVNSSFFGSPISPLLSRTDDDIKHSPPSSICKTSPEVLNSTPLRAGRHVTIEDQSSFASILGLTPVKSTSERDDAPTPKKNLFQNHGESAIECTITKNSIELVHHTPTKRDSSKETMIPPRIFGSRAQNLLNRMDNDKTDSPAKMPTVVRRFNILNQELPYHFLNENTRGVRLNRADKLKSLGLESFSSSCSLNYDDSLDRSDF